MNKSYVYSRVMMEHLLYIWHVYTHIHAHAVESADFISMDIVGSGRFTDIANSSFYCLNQFAKS